jgi:hypothetical protein
MIVMSFIATVFVLTCIYGLLFTKSDVEDMTGKIFAGFVGFVVFPLGVVESVRYLSRLDEQGITHRTLLRDNASWHGTT